MIVRIAALFGLSLAFVAGAIAVADQMTVAQTEAPPAAQPNAPMVQPAATNDNAKDQTPATPTTPAPAAVPATPAPAVAPAPVVTAPPNFIVPPVVTLPSSDVAPAPTTPPVVAVPPPATETPPVATTPPAPVVSLPPSGEAPLPPDKPDIATAKKDVVAAKALFAAEKLPSLGKAMAIGYYPRGCLSGGVALPVNGPTWQVMRVSRNRNWGHPSLVHFLEKFAPLAAKATGWKGILVGDMAQPRGGPTPFGHRSHQTGLDVDIWFMPMPERVLNKEEREKISAINLVSADWKGLNPKTWTPQHADFIRVAAAQPEVERVLVNAAIKKEMCRMQGKKHPEWMNKVRPWYAHHDHIHVRLKCPADSPNCRGQPPVPGDDGCSDKALAFWFSDRVLHPKPAPKPAKPPRPITMADLPPACKGVLEAPAKTIKAALP